MGRRLLQILLKALSRGFASQKFEHLHKFCGIVLEIIRENVNMRKFSYFSPIVFISVDLKLYKLLYDHTTLIIFLLSIAIENMSKDTGNTLHSTALLFTK